MATKRERSARQRRKRVRQTRKQRFLAILRQCGNVTAAADALQINRVTHYRWLKADPKYAKEVEDALDEGIDRVLIEIRRRAVDGVPEPVGWYKGEAGGMIKRYSDNLAMFLVKARRPEYRDNARITLVPGGAGDDGNADLGRKLLDEMDEEALRDD